MKLNLTRAILLFFAAYIIVTILATGTTLTYGMITHAPEAAPGISPVKAPVFVATVPFHVLIMLIIWPIFAAIYFKKSSKPKPWRRKNRNLEPCICMDGTGNDRRLCWICADQASIFLNGACVLCGLPTVDQPDLYRHFCKSFYLADTVKAGRKKEKVNDWSLISIIFSRAFRPFKHRPIEYIKIQRHWPGADDTLGDKITIAINWFRYGATKI